MVKGSADTTLSAIPLVGREEELAAARAALSRGGCVIAGRPGVGKSRLAAEAAARGRMFAGRILATAAARTIPFGAFSHFLPPSDSGPDNGLPDYLAALRAHLGRDATIVVDDAHLLDDASAALLLAIVETKAAKPVVTIRSAERPPDAVVSLWKEGMLERIELQQLTRADAARLVDAILGQPSHASVYARIYEVTEGNPLYAREVVLDALRKGSLKEEDGRWHLTGVPLPMERLRDLVSARTFALSDLARTALEFLSVAAPVTLDRLEALTSLEAVDELEAAELVTVGGPAGSQRVELAHPVYGEVTAEALPAATTRARYRALAELPMDESDRDDLLRVATWKLEAGESDEELFLKASRRALQAATGVCRPGWARAEAGLAIRLARGAGPGLEANICLAEGLVQMDEYPAVEAVLGPLEVEAASAGPQLATSYLRARAFALHWGGTDTDSALGLLERAAHWHGDRGWAVSHATNRGWILLDLGRPAEARSMLEPLLSVTDIDERTRFDLLAVIGIAYGRLGLMALCEGLDAEIRELADRIEGGAWDTGWAKHLVDGVARTEGARDLSGVAARLYAVEADAQERGDYAMLSAVRTILGRLELIRGHTASAVRVLRAAVDGLSRSDPRNALGLAATYLARAHGLRGEAETGQIVLEKAKDQARRRPNNLRLGLELSRATAWVDVAHGRLSAAGEILMKAADDAGEDLMGAAEALYGAVRVGVEPREPASRLAELSNAMDNELIETCAFHAVAIAQSDYGAQLEAAQRFSDLGVDLFAAEAAALASEILRSEGKRSSAQRAAAMASMHARRCEGARTPALHRLVPAGGLTPREREVAELAARGHSNADIAESLSLSVRSVETYVLRACRKLGLDGRTQIEQALLLQR